MKKILNGFLAVFFLLTVTFVAKAEDTEIYKDLPLPANANIMFILDLSGSMLWDLYSENKAADPSIERLAVMKLALDNVLSDPDLKDINIGLMSFSGINSAADSVAHGPTFPVEDANFHSEGALIQNPKFDPNIDDSAMYLSIKNNWSSLNTKYNWLATKKDSWIYKKINGIAGAKKTTKQKASPTEISAKEYMRLAASTWQASNGGTPIVDALYEAALYFKGKKVDYGRYLATDHRAAHPSSYTGEMTLTPGALSPVCSFKTCGGSSGLACDSPSDCTDYPAGSYIDECWKSTAAECELDPNYSNCKFIPNQDCSDTCPSNQYDEFGKCKKPVNVCVDDNYFECEVSYNAYTECKKEVCTMKPGASVLTGNPVYISPIKDECQSNTLILMTDGRPTLNKSANRVTNLIPSKYSNNCKNNGDSSATPIDVNYAGRCGPELVSYLHNEDQSPLTGKQTIETSTIGFALNANAEAAKYLATIAKKGGGQFYDAKDGDALVESFKSAIASVGKKARAFATPTFVVDPSNMLEHQNEVYLPLFTTKRGPLWSGNLKKFTLKDGEIVDKLKIAATSATGVLRADAQDEWAKTVPDHAVEGGGAASLLDPAKRNLLTDASVSITAGSGNVLNQLSKPSVTKVMLGDGSMSDAFQDKLLSFIRGYESDGKTARHHMGDIVHSKPVVVSYASEKRVFVGTNEGYLHSFDADTGEEKFAFMPETLLKNIIVQYNNNSKDKHLSGVDGEITVWVQDTNHNAKVDTGEKVYLFFGLRRGGRAYYALDVSDPTKDPKLLWRIDPSQSDFSELGQTWSKPVLARLRYGKNKDLRPVLIFGGGYNTRIDEEDISLRPAASTSNKGTSVYIVNAETGALIWRADNLNITEDMKYSVPSTISALDMDRNGSVDRLYFGDMGGNVWRVDLNAGDFIPKGDLHDVSKATLHKLAELGGSGKDLRKFFYEPDVAFFKNYGSLYLTIAMGSGYRSHPLNENITDRFYVLRDKYVLNTPDSNFKTIEKDSGVNLVKAPVDKKLNLLDAAYYGWYLDLTATQHEKILSPAVTFMNRVAFSSFGKTSSTTGATAGSCDVKTNFQSRAYVLDLLRGHAVIDFDSSSPGNEVSIKTSNEEIISTPQIFFNKIRSSKGKACSKNDCGQTFSIRAGKNKSSFVNKATSGGKVNISNELPKVFWRAQGS